MKKRYLIMASLLFVGTMTLASCGSNYTITNNDTTDSSNLTNNVNSIIQGNSSSTSKTLEYDPVYESLDVTLNTLTTPSSSTDIEEAVENIYDSVTSITATSASSISSGSAVLFAKDNKLGFSYLVTCFHVIEDAYSFVVTESDGDEYEAFLVGGYEDEDLAILAIKTPEADDLTYASFFEDTNELKLGSTVICIGNPLGTLPGSISVGVVSYNNRTVKVDTYKSQTLIQTDVAINSGNSGGGLFNGAGALIGIVSAKYSSSGIEGLGFAIPGNTVKDVINELMSTAKYDSANDVWYTGYYEGDYEYGFTLSIGTYSTGYGFNTTRRTVAYVSDVTSKDTYTGTSLQVNDIIESVSIDYKDSNRTDSKLTSFSSVSDIMNYLYNSDVNVGDTITFNITRSNTSKSITFDVMQFRYTI